MTAANDRIVGAVAGSTGGMCWKFFPPSPTAIRKIITMGIQAKRSYLKIPLLTFIPCGLFNQPMKNFPAAEGDKKGYDGDDDNPYADSEQSARRVCKNSNGNYLQLRFPSSTAASVWPPRMQSRMQNPVMPMRFSKAGAMTPK
jgi:hypothetical protein